MSLIRLTLQGEQPVQMDWLRQWRASGASLTPFSPQAVEACAALSRALFADSMAKTRPDLVALAYWLRQASVKTMTDTFAATVPNRCKVVPRGICLHFPPTNVDTVMAYTWALSLLAGDRSLIRVSGRQGPSGQRLLDLMMPVAENALFLRTPHDDAVTAELCSLADVRVVWGGDRTTGHLRAIPAPPRCRDVLFPDRRSLAAMALTAYDAAGAAERDRLADAFALDTLTFDQMACSSPRLLAWVGQGDAAATSRDFFTRVAQAAHRRGMEIPLGQVLAKRTIAAGSVLDGAATGWFDLGSEITVLDWCDPADEPAEWTGGGLFLAVHVTRLADLATACDARTQTLAVHGFPETHIAELVAEAAERCPDRIVPFGHALAFGHVWDGLDLLREFTRLVHVSA